MKENETIADRIEATMEGNVQKMREALREALGRVNEIYDIISKPCIVIEEARKACREARGVLIPALATPLRNCDVGTAREQYRRFMDECSKRNCRQCLFCPYKMHLTCGRDECFAVWAQMPYEKGGAK